MKSLHMLLFTILAGGIIAAPAMASGGAAAAAAVIAASNNKRAEQSAEIVIPPQRNDGFIETSEFYRDGPVFRICPGQDGKSIVARPTGCAVKTRIRDGFFSLSGYHYEYDMIGPGMDPQAFLDNQFGAGVTIFAEVSSRLLGGRARLVIFYSLSEVSGQ